jgi:hypothetical protein
MSRYEDQLRLKKYLVLINIILGVTIIVLLIFGIMFIQPKLAENAKKLQQYMFFDLADTPKNTDVALTDHNQNILVPLEVVHTKSSSRVQQENITHRPKLD